MQEVVNNTGNELRELSSRMFRHGNYFDEAHEYGRMNDCYKAAEILRSIASLFESSDEIIHRSIEQ